jgi:hypothetical protein
MPALNGGTGNINILKQPRGSTAVGTNWGYYASTAKRLVSCNAPMICQVRWGLTLSRVTNLMVESAYLAGDLVNVIFDVYIGNGYNNSANQATGNMILAGSLRKSRDLPYVANMGIDPQWSDANLAVDYHTFTVDIAPVVKNYLTYTLTPLLKGSPSAQFQMSGSYSQNNFLDYTSVQGSYVYVDIVARFEVYEQNAIVSKRLVIADNGGVQTKDFNNFTAINSAPQEYDNPITNDYWIVCTGATTSKKFLTNKPNEDFGGKGISGYSSVRMDDEGEFLSWFQLFFAKDASNVYDMTDYYLRVETSDGDYCNVRDFQEVLGGPTPGTSAFWSTTFTGVSTPKMILSNNVSPAYLNTLSTWNLGQKINANTEWYSVKLVCSGTTLGSGVTVSESRYYKIDREPANLPYGFVRFHWLNRMGGIDSYTAKRNVTEGITANKVFFERKSPSTSLYAQEYTTGAHETPANSAQDPIGNDSYKGAVNTFSIEATLNKSVYTEPLNSAESKWLEELLTSPNVWIELENDKSVYAKARNASMHPSDKDYFPVTITNADFTSINQEEGLVKLNIEYTMANPINTQSN